MVITRACLKPPASSQRLLPSRQCLPSPIPLETSPSSSIHNSTNLFLFFVLPPLEKSHLHPHQSPSHLMAHHQTFASRPFWNLSIPPCTLFSFFLESFVTYEYPGSFASSFGSSLIAYDIVTMKLDATTSLLLSGMAGLGSSHIMTVPGTLL